MQKIVAIDGNNLGFAGMANPKLSSGEIDTQSVFAVIKKVRKFFLDYPPDTLFVVLWDGKSWRKKILPEYKENRIKNEDQVKDREAYFIQRKLIREALDYLGVTQMIASNLEADDLAAIMVKNMTKDQEIDLITSDKDWLQLINRRVKWIDPINERECDHTSFNMFTGYPNVAQFIESKCILGDAGDNIKGIKGVGPVTLDKIYNLGFSFLNFMHFTKEEREELWVKQYGGKFPKVLANLDREETIELMKKNSQLMNLIGGWIPKAENLVRTRRELDKKKFEELCFKLSFLSITSKLDVFLKPFEDNINVK